MEIRSDADVAGGRCFTEAFRQDRETGRALFRAAIRYWTKEVSGGAWTERAALATPIGEGSFLGGER